MYIKDLRNYNKWIGKKPSTILFYVKLAGGWEMVFPANKPFPLWASRVRNFFNEYPRKLKLLNEKKGDDLSDKVNNSHKFGLYQRMIMDNTLSDDVYIDESGRLWYEMATAGTGYHFEDRNRLTQIHPKVKAIKGKFTPQSQIPVFKLISPDRTGGSLEICIHNPQVYNSVWQCLNPFTACTGGKKRVGSVDQWASVGTRLVTDEVFRGSYNYSETVKMSLEAHERRDVKPHRATHKFYINPHHWSKLEDRIFPERDSNMKYISYGYGQE